MMVNKKWVSASLAVSFGLSGAYTTAAAVADAGEQVQGNAVFYISSDVTAQKEQIAKFEEIKSLFAEETVDLKAVKAYYQENFQTAVQQRKQLIDDNISVILEAGVNGQATTGQVKQAVDKGLQWFFYEEINHLVRTQAGEALKAGNKEEAKQYLDQAIALFEGSIYVTAGKRDNDFGTLTQDHFENFIVPGLQNAVEAGDVTAFNVSRQYFQKTMMKVFVLATAKYGAKVEADHAAGDVEAEKAHLSEGYFFFMPIAEYLAGGSQEASDYIKNAFKNGDGSKVNGEEIKSKLALAITEKVKEYAGKTINTDLASGDLAGAKVHAAEGNAFLSQLEVIGKERLGEAKWAEIEQHATLYNQAVIANNAAEAQKHAEAIIEPLEALSNVQAVTDVSVQQSQVEKFEEIKSFFSEETVDLQEVKAYYEENFKALVQGRQQLIDDKISFVLEAGVNGQATAGQVKQAVDKGLQWFFYEEINHLVRMQAGEALKAGNKELAKQYLDQAITLFNGTIYVTAGKRDNDFGTLTQVFFESVVVPGLQDAVSTGDVTAFNVNRQYFQKTMMKVFVLATAKYGAKVEADHAAGDLEAEKAHLSEGYFFFMPIANYLAGGSQEASNYIVNAFESGDGSKVDGEKVKSMLARAISVKVSEYAGKAINNDLASGDLAGAKVHAAEGNAFLSQLEVIGKESLGASKWAEIEHHATLYNKAVIANNSSEARKHAFGFIKPLATISGIHFEIGGKTLYVKGKAVTNKEATSYLDKSTNRTLASARFISEALGAEVSWDNAARKVTIDNGIKTVSFVIGSKDVYVNGKKSDYKLDQAAVIKDRRSYIPVRAAAELLDGKVFYSQGEVVINN